MRIIYNPKTFEVQGVIADRVTSHIPKSTIGDATKCLDIDYDDKALKTKNPLAIYLEGHQNELLGKLIIIKGKNITFKDKPKPEQVKTVIVDLDKPLLDKDCKLYANKAEKMGATVEIDDIGSTILAKIMYNNEVAGIIRLVKRNCCAYLYEEGRVENRSVYPHYIGFYTLITYLFGKAKWLDMGGFVRDNEDLNSFKRKWGKETFTELA